MKALIITALLSVATPCLAAPVDLPVKIADGATWMIDSARVRVDERGDATRKIESAARYQASYRAGPGGGILTLRPISSSLYGEIVGAPALSGFELPLELDVDERLTPVRVRNWPALREALSRFLDAPTAGGQPVDPKVAETAKAVFRSLSDERAPGIVFPPSHCLGLGQGHALEPGKPQPFEGQRPHPLGGAPVKTRGSFALESHDRKAGRAVVLWTEVLDPQSLSASLREADKALVASSRQAGQGVALDETVAKMSMSRDNRCRFEIDAASGLAVKTECASTVDISVPGEPQARSIDRWTITQTLPGKP